MLWDYKFLVLWWLIFFLAHSIMASSALKKMITTNHPIIKSYYRLFFNLVSSLLLVPITYYYFSSPNEIVYKTSPLIQVIGSLITLAGSYVLIAGFKNYRTDEFIGTYQIKNHHEFHPTQLNKKGWNGIVRHPLYFGSILIAFGLCLISPSIKLSITAALVIAYLYIGTMWEEKKLISEFGDTYKTYKKEVSMLIPFKWLKNRISGK